MSSNSNSSTDTIPLVDLSNSQEDEYELTEDQKRKGNEVVQIVDSPNVKKPRLSDCIPPKARQNPQGSENELASLHQRLNSLEKLVAQVPFQTLPKGQYVTREEYEEILGRVERIEQRIDKVEKIFGSIKSAFEGIVPSQISRTTSTSSIGKQTKSPSENSRSFLSKPAESDTGTVKAAAGNSKPTSSDSATPRTSKEPANVPAASKSSKPTANVPAQPIINPKFPTPRSNIVKSLNTQNVHVTPGPSTSGTQPLRTGAENSPLQSTELTASSTMRPVVMTTTNNVLRVSPGTTNSKRSFGQPSTNPGLSSTSPSTSQPRTSSAPLNIRNLSPSITVTPISNNRNSVQNAQLPSSTVTPSGRDHQTTNATISSDHLRNNLSEILSEPPCSQNDLNILQGQEELPEGIIGNIHVKQELYDSYPLEKVDTLCFRKEKDNGKEYILIYIGGGGRKVRNQSKYAAIGQLSLSDTWIRVLPFLSDLDTTNPNKQIRTIQAEAEIIAAVFALEDVKRNSIEPDPLRVTIVTKSDKLKTIMSDPGSYYFNLNSCVCTAFPCGHPDRWMTLDTFAQTFPDDLPRLVLATCTRRIEVRWRTYASDRQDGQMKEFFRQNFQTKMRSFLKMAK
ncbi:hypothetical protein ONE63_005578 [Megalurothrips usitatus]|uniref:Uncharacterized protein n=1 Tax=Megalurothrips usitatus TaxID=439358 RepID=A0AAV7XYI9_9NEOP|nr:hypothetical protein ONE63_005578 [Megalurothrips usitatus]